MNYNRAVCFMLCMQITTDYSMEAESSLCYAVRPFRAEEQVREEEMNVALIFVTNLCVSYSCMQRDCLFCV